MIDDEAKGLVIHGGIKTYMEEYQPQMLESKIFPMDTGCCIHNFFGGSCG